MAKDGKGKVEVISLWEALASVPDPRDDSGKRHPLPAVLTLSAVAMLSGARSVYAIAQFGRDRGREFAAALGFTRDRAPCGATLHYVFKALDGAAFEAAVRRWARGRCASAAWEVIDIDGKTLRGIQGHAVPGVHVLAAYAHEARAVLDQIPVGAKTNEHKAALELLDLIPLKGKLVTGDAAFCQRDLSKKANKKGATGCGS
jgi:predicted transposase YbfD/YdcC